MNFKSREKLLASVAALSLLGISPQQTFAAQITTVAVPQSGHEKARKKRVHHELMAHPPKTTNNFTKLITYQSSSFCLPASLLHPM